MTDTIEALENIVESCRVKLQTAERALRQARTEAAEFKVGDIVEAKGYARDEWRRAIIDGVSFRWSSNPSYHVRFANKGGEWSKQVRTYVTVRALPE